MKRKIQRRPQRPANQGSQRLPGQGEAAVGVKGTTMKLIQIFVLTAAMATFASGQSGANNTGSTAKTGGTSTATPAKNPMAAHPAPGMKAKHAAHAAVVQAAKPVKAKSGAAQPAGAKAGAPAVKKAETHAASKPVVAMGSLPVSHPHPGTSVVNSRPARAGAPLTRKLAVSHLAEKSKQASKTAKPGVVAKGTIVKKAPPRVMLPKPKVARVEPAAMPQRKAVTPAKLLGAAGRRDPFVSPIRSASALSPTQSCRSGKRCLAIPELILQGTVRDVTGRMMAVVSTSNRRTYTLRENDQVYNGSVEKITSDSIIFREYTKDAVGRETAKEVVKKMGPTS
jgi:hypothetical protein